MSRVPFFQHCSSASTVSFMSRVQKFCCGGRAIEMNTLLGSSSPQNLIVVGLYSNRGQRDELELVIDCAARSVNRCL